VKGGGGGSEKGAVGRSVDRATTFWLHSFDFIFYNKLVHSVCPQASRKESWL